MKVDDFHHFPEGRLRSDLDSWCFMISDMACSFRVLNFRVPDGASIRGQWKVRPHRIIPYMELMTQ